MPQAVKISDVKEKLEKLVKDNKFTDDAYVKQSPGEVVAYLDYLNTEHQTAQKILDSILDTYFVEGIAGRKIPKITASTKTIRVKVGETAPKPIINFRSFIFYFHYRACLIIFIYIIYSIKKIFNIIKSYGMDFVLFILRERIFYINKG